MERLAGVRDLAPWESFLQRFAPGPRNREGVTPRIQTKRGWLGSSRPPAGAAPDGLPGPASWGLALRAATPATLGFSQIGRRLKTCSLGLWRAIVFLTGCRVSAVMELALDSSRPMSSNTAGQVEFSRLYRLRRPVVLSLRKRPVKMEGPGRTGGQTFFLKDRGSDFFLIFEGPGVRLFSYFCLLKEKIRKIVTPLL